eukprot:729188-Rhodomonas_salina.2
MKEASQGLRLSGSSDTRADNSNSASGSKGLQTLPQAARILRRPRRRRMACQPRVSFNGPVSEPWPY